MKKLLSMLSVITLVGSSTISVVSCQAGKVAINDKGSVHYKGNNEIYYDSQKKPDNEGDTFNPGKDKSFGYKTQEDFLNETKEGQPTSSYWMPTGYPNQWKDKNNLVNSVFDWSPSNDMDAKYNRSTVPLAIHEDVDSAQYTNSKQDHSGDVRHLEVGMSDPANTNNPSQGFLNTFNGYNFTNWQYASVYTAWQGSCYDGVIATPTPGFVDAAHKNGVPVLGMVFFDAYDNKLQHDQLKHMFDKNSDGSYKLTDKLLEIADYYGFDGWFWNDEDVVNDFSPEIQGIMQQFEVKKTLKQSTSHMIFSSYLPNQPLSDNQKARDYLLHEKINPDGSKSYSKVSDMEDINGYATDYAELIKNNPEFKNLKWNMFNQLDIGGDHRDEIENGQSIPDMRKRVTDLSGKYSSSLTTFAAADAIKWAPENLDKIHPGTTGQKRDLDINHLFNLYEDQFEAGKTRNPKLDTDDNLATIIGEKTPIVTNEFTSSFSTGNGIAYYTNGVSVGKTDWNNRSVSDIAPTYHWVVANDDGNTLQANYDYQTAYNKGNSIVLAGDWNYDKADYDGASLKSGSSSTIDLFGTHTLMFDQDVNLKFKASDGSKDISTHVKPQFVISGKDFDGNTINYISNVQPKEIKDSNGWYEINDNLENFVDHEVGNQVKEITKIAIKFTSDQNYNNAKINLGQFSLTDKDHKYNDMDFIKNIEVEYAINRKNGTNIRFYWDNEQKAYDNYEIYIRDSQNNLTFEGTTRENAYYIKNVAKGPLDLCIKVKDPYSSSGYKMTCQVFSL